METQKATRAPYTMNDFFNRIRKVRKETVEQIKLWHDFAEGYASHPGMVTNMNLFIDPDGRVWAHATQTDANGEPLLGFRPHVPNATICDRIRQLMGWYEFHTDLPKGTKRAQLEPCVWEKPTWLSRREAEENTLREIKEYLGYAANCQRTIVFLDLLLQHRSELETWLVKRAAATVIDRQRKGWEDREELFKLFQKRAGADEESDGYMELLNITPALHQLLDTLAGQPYIVRYY